MGTDNMNDVQIYTIIDGKKVPATAIKDVNLSEDDALQDMIKLAERTAFEAGKNIGVAQFGEAICPKRIIRCGPATIVFWLDGEKTVVKRSPGEEDSLYAAYCAALAIRVHGSNSALKRMIDSMVVYQNVEEQTDESNAG